MRPRSSRAPALSETGSPRPGKPARELLALVAVWVVVSLILTTLAARNVSSPGLYYDEAVFPALARDFLTANPHGVHMINTESISLCGRPFPLFVQAYLGAVKSWLLIPVFFVFGPSIIVLRLTALFWCSIGLLLCMLWTRKLLGLPAALLVAPLLAFDPSFYFASVLDWGSVNASFACRLCGYYLFLLWWRKGRLWHALLAAVCLGIGFLNKIDFVVILVGCGIAVALTWRKEVLASIRAKRATWALCGLAFLLGAGPMTGNLWSILQGVFRYSGPKGEVNWPKELLEKINVAGAMYDGSYFFRMSEVGGRFPAMFMRPSAVWSPFGWAVILAAVLLVVHIALRKGDAAERRRQAFLLLGAVLTTLGVLLLPRAVKIHHSTLVYPFPHLLVVAAAVMLWKKSQAGAVAKWGIRTCVVGMVGMVIAGQLVAILKTQNLMTATGGRGFWSDSIRTFCDDVKTEPGVPVVALDWGFVEQLDFLCDRRPLSEPIWADQQFAVTSRSFCLVHPPEYTVFRSGWDFYNAVRDKFRRNMSIQAYRDRQGKVAFYALRVYGAGNMSMQAYRDPRGKVDIYALRVSGFEPGPKRDAEIEAAIAHFRRALKISPDSAQDHFNLGALLEGRGSVAEAIAHYGRALEIRPDDAEVRYNLGLALYRPGTIAQAVPQLREAVQCSAEQSCFRQPAGVGARDLPGSIDPQRRQGGSPCPVGDTNLPGPAASLSGHAGRCLRRDGRLLPGDRGRRTCCCAGLDPWRQGAGRRPAHADQALSCRCPVSRDTHGAPPEPRWRYLSSPPPSEPRRLYPK